MHRAFQANAESDGYAAPITWLNAASHSDIVPIVAPRFKLYGTMMADSTPPPRR